MLTNHQLHILAAIWECPMEEPLDNCPFNQLRKKSFKEQVEYVSQLSNMEAEAMFYKHLFCNHYRKFGNLDVIDK